MFNLFDIMQSEGGIGLGRQYGLSPDQSRRAMEALLPALTMGLQRNAVNDPAGLGRMFGLAGPEAGRAQPTAQADLLGQLFGSPALAQAVLQQASSASGIGTQALRQMLPMMAGMVVAGIVHLIVNQPPPAQPALREPEPRPDFSNASLWNDWMNTFLSPPVAATPSRTTPREAEKSKPLSAPEKPAADASASSAELFQQMFQSGIQAQERNVEAMQSLFDSFWSSPGSAAPNDAVPAAANAKADETAPASPCKSRAKSEVR